MDIYGYLIKMLMDTSPTTKKRRVGVYPEYQMGCLNVSNLVIMDTHSTWRSPSGGNCRHQCKQQQQALSRALHLNGTDGTPKWFPLIEKIGSFGMFFFFLHDSIQHVRIYIYISHYIYISSIVYDHYIYIYHLLYNVISVYSCIMYIYIYHYI